MSKLILLRHGQSAWNLENRFTGWIDIDLTPQGMTEAREAGQKIKVANIHIDEAFTSVLKRAIDTLTLCLHSCGQENVPVSYDQALNERHYGDLQGLNKDETAEKFGADQVKIWRRSYSVRPPGGESLEDTAARTLPYFKQHIVPALQAGKNVIVSAHGNSLRAIIMFLDQLTEEQVIELNVPNGVPIVYDFDSKGNPLAKSEL
jgi:2,3-bisphosphoglycerate-dependent phosphoglycerate mutase